MNVLSLFDGMSCCQIALKELGVKVDSYYASEVDKYAIQTTMHNFPNTIQLGDVAKIDTSTLPEIGLLAGGSPCQSFSFAGKRKGMSTTCSTEILTLDHYLQLKEEGFEFEGQSYLFWEYMRILKEVKPKYFLLENVEMGEKWEKILSRAIGMNGIHINSALVSAQNRKRIYWTNIGAKPSGLFGDLASAIPQPKDQGILLKHILEQDVDEKYFLSEKAIKYLNRDSLGKYSSRLAFMNYEDKSKSTCVTANHSKGIPYNMVTCHNTMPRSENPEKETAILQPKRTEYGKKFRKEYEEGKIKRGLVQQLEPRVDGKTNTITSVHKDNLVIQLNILSNTEKLPIFANSKIENNEKQNKRRPNQTLQALQRIIGTKKDGEWQMAVYARFYENEVLFNELFIGKLQTKKESSLNNKEREATGSKINANVEMYDLLCKRWEGCASHRQKSVKQLIRQFAACLSELPQHDTQKEIALQNLWKNAKRIGILRKALSEVQKIWESFDDKAQSVHRDYRIRRLTPKEAKRLQTVPEHYDMNCVSETQQYKMLGNGWTIEVIKHILSHM